MTQALVANNLPVPAFTGLTPLGSLLGGFLAEGWGTRTSLLVTAAGMMLSPS